MRISDWSSDVCSSDLSTREWRAVASAAVPSPFARAIRTRIPHAAENVMSIAAINSRNQFKGNIVAIHRPPVVSEIEVETPSGILSAIVPTSSVERLPLRLGDEVLAVFKAPDVLVDTPD